MISIEKLRETFDYDPLAGVLTWRSRPREDFANHQAWRSWLIRFAGKSVGGNDRGYVSLAVTIEGTTHQLRAHRIIWALIHGYWPIHEIDHRNGDRSDNRLANLREATHAENYQNLALRPTGGAYLNRERGRFQAQIRAGGKRVYLGRFATHEEAHAAYLAAKAELHTFQPIPRGP